MKIKVIFVFVVCVHQFRIFIPGNLDDISDKSDYLRSPERGMHTYLGLPSLTGACDKKFGA